MKNFDRHPITDARGNVLVPGSRVQMGSPLHNREGQQAEVLSVSDEHGHHTAAVRFDDGYEDVVLAANLVPAPAKTALVDAAGRVAAGDPGLISANHLPELVADHLVWVSTARRGIDYHRPEPTNATTCGRTTRYGEILRRSNVVDRFGSKPCRRCYPHGEDAAPLVDGQHLRAAHTEPARAGVLKASPNGHSAQRPARRQSAPQEVCSAE